MNRFLLPIIGILLIHIQGISQVSSSPATITSAADIADIGMGADIRIEFNKAPDESKVGSYEVIVVPSGMADTFDLTDANEVLTWGLFMSEHILPTGSNIVSDLDDVYGSYDGGTISDYIPYKLFVLSVADGVNAQDNALSNASNEFILTPSGNLSRTDSVDNLVITDIGSSGNGSDIQASFNKVSNEAEISAYRILLVKSSKADSYSLSLAEANTYYKEVAPTDSNIVTNLSSSFRDTDGDLITYNVGYNAFVLSMYDTLLTQLNNISDSSNELILDFDISLITEADAISNLLVLDVNNNNNASDMQISFSRASDEGSVSEYRAFVVKSSESNSFDITTANSSLFYESILPNDSNIKKVLSDSLLDSDGDSIQEEIAYKIFISSVADGTLATINKLSSSSNELTLSPTVSIDESNPFQETVILFPNPTNGRVFIDLGLIRTYALITVMDASGKTIRSYESRDKQMIDLDIEGKTGLYVVSVSTETEQTILKLIKQ